MVATPASPSVVHALGRLADATIAVGAAAALFVPVLLTDPAAMPGFAWPLGAAATVPLAWRRRAPLLVLALVGLAQCAWALAGLEPLGYPTIAVAVALYTVAGSAVEDPRLRGAGLTVAAAVVGVRLAADGPAMAGWTALVCAIGWLAGELAAARRGYVAALRDKVRWLEVSRAQEARLAVAEERARIARELHDIVGHAMSLIALRAGVGAHLADRDAGAGAEALRVIEQVSREALDELRRMLGMLRDDEETRGPLPTLDALPALCERVARVGAPVTIRTLGDPRPLPASLQLNAYRIVQEALTNNLRHGNGGQTSVTVEYRDDALLLDIQGSAPAPAKELVVAEGHGLRGIRERVGLFGGTVHAGPRLGGGFQVYACLPLAQPASQEAP